MIDFIKKAFGQEPTSDREHSDDVKTHDVRLAACALFLEMARIDNEFDSNEREMILAILKDEYGLSEGHAKVLAEEAEKERKKSLDLWHFTELINRHFSREEKIHVVEMLWKIIYVDGKLDGHEDYLVHTLANMLNLSHEDLIETKLNVLYDQDE